MTPSGTPVKTATGSALRLRSLAQLNAVRAGGSSYATRTCVVNCLKTPSDSSKRAAFSVSKRFSLLAVERNRARRLFREIFRRLLPVLPPVWIIFVPRRRMKNAMMQEVLQDVLLALGNLGVSLLGEPKRD